MAAEGGWSRLFSMKKESEAHETLSLLFTQDGVPNVMIIDGAKEQVLGGFKRKTRLADCHLKQMKPYTPWSNAAEGTIQELKKDCAKLESLICSHTVHNIFMLKGEAPETLISRQTAGISDIIIIITHGLP
jgi:hypothetical protein